MLDQQALLEFLKAKADERDVSSRTGLVIAAIYDGLAVRIQSGVFDMKGDDA